MNNPEEGERKMRPVAFLRLSDIALFPEALGKDANEDIDSEWLTEFMELLGGKVYVENEKGELVELVNPEPADEPAEPGEPDEPKPADEPGKPTRPLEERLFNNGNQKF